MALTFPPNQFPSLHAVIIYGSILSTQAVARPVPSLADFILVVDDEKIPLEQWHQQNFRLNPEHYGSLSGAAVRTRTYASFPMFFSPLSKMTFQSSPPESKNIKQLSKYIVVTKKDLEKDLREWNQLYLAGRLQKPALIYVFPHQQGGEAQQNVNLTQFDLTGSVHLEQHRDCTLRAAMQENILNAARLGLLASDHLVPLRDLLRTIATLSYTGDIRNLFFDETRRARGLVSTDILSFIHLYIPSLSLLRDRWKLTLDEGDDEVLKARYVPNKFRSHSESIGGPAASFDLNDTEFQFSLEFEKPHHADLLADLIQKTAAPLRKHVTENLEAKLLGYSSSRSKLPAELVDAAKLLSKEELILRQSFSSEAHCSLFHALPDNLQRHAIGVSAKDRLLRILGPFTLLDSARDQEILGGPLPWEKKCLEGAIKKIVRKSSCRALLKAVPMVGPKRAGLYGLQKLFGHVHV